MEDDEFIARKEFIKKLLDECEDPKLINVMELICDIILYHLKE